MSVHFDLTKIGVLGGGQLGRMLIQSAIDFNLPVSILDPDPEAPCKDIASSFTIGKLTDYEAIMEFGRHLDVITIEIENVNADALKSLQEDGKHVYPQPEVIKLIQDKSLQKQFYIGHNIPTAPYILVENKEEMAEKVSEYPVVNKLSREGYDGRGVRVITSENDVMKAFDAPGVVEKYIDFEKEISVITARNPSGEVVTYPVVELVFHPERNLVEFLFSPAQIDKNIEEDARGIATNLIKELEMVGILAVEMFVTRQGEVLVNESAPRPHNSGHQTIEGSFCSQYEQHLRAILDWPLGNTDIRIPTAMVNLLGEDGFTGPAKYEGMEEILAMEGAHVHLYGKKLTRPFRKMGHVTICEKNVGKLNEKARFVKRTLKVRA